MWAVKLEHECSACKAVADEIHVKIKDEGVRGAVDMRSRIDSTGSRTGRVVSYYESEMRVHDLIHGSDRYTHVCNRMHLFHLSGKEGSEGRQWVASSVWGDAGGSTPQDVGTTSPRLRKWCYEFTDDVEEAFYAPVRDGKLTPVNGEPPSQAAVREALCVEAAGLCTAEEVPDMDWKAVADRERQEREEEEERRRAEEEREQAAETGEDGEGDNEVSGEL